MCFLDIAGMASGTLYSGVRMREQGALECPLECAGTMANDVEIWKSSRVTMQAFCECGFVQIYCNK